MLFVHFSDNSSAIMSQKAFAFINKPKQACVSNSAEAALMVLSKTLGPKKAPDAKQIEFAFTRSSGFSKHLRPKITGSYRFVVLPDVTVERRLLTFGHRKRI